MGTEIIPSQENAEETQTAPVTEWDKLDLDADRQLAESVERQEKERALGAKILSIVGFNIRHREIVDSSFGRARKTGQKLVGKNGERRSDAYVARVERIIGQRGTKAEQRLWDMTAASDDLVVRPENVPESFWKTQAQIKRDNGLDEYISDYEKSLLIEDAQEHQRESIKSWSDYLGHKECPYPMWFKLFAWDGVSKMSAVYDKNTRRFAKRDETTMAPYPFLNPAILAQVYEAICKVNGLCEEDETAESSLDEATEKIVKTYNFNNLYSLFLSRQKAAPEVPKNPEDVRGDWIEYLPGEEKALAEAAAGTPWCVASPEVGKNYLMGGVYGTGEVEEAESKAKFILFHLQDEHTGELADSACASIRLDTEGNVAEISGIQEGQVLDDALVPIVEEKVKTLPGGEKYLEAFADKRRLIEIDRKMKNGEELSDDELRFIYELDRPIHRIERYGNDVRVDEAKQKYPLSSLIERKITNIRGLKKIFRDRRIDDVAQLIDAGVDIKTIIEDGNYGVQDIDDLLAHNVSREDIIELFWRRREWLFDNFDYLASRGFTAIEIAERMPASRLLGHLDFLDENGISYNIQEMVRKAIRNGKGDVVLDNSEAIIARGGKINFKKIAKRVNDYAIVGHADAFCDSGHKEIVEQAMKKLDGSSFYYYRMSNNIGAILDSEIEIETEVLEEIINDPGRDLEQVLLNIDKILSRGIEIKIDISELVQVLEGGPREIFDVVVKHPDLFNLQEVYEKMPRWVIIQFLEELIENGIEIDVKKLAEKANAEEKLLHKETFEKYGVQIDVDSEIGKLDGFRAFSLLENYLNHEGATNIRDNVDKIAKIVLSSMESNKELKNMAKPLLWRLGYIK